MRRSSIYLRAISYILSSILAPILFESSSYASQPLKLTDADKAQILNSVLRREIGITKRTDVKAILLLKNEIINRAWLPAIPNVEITLINNDEVKARRTTSGKISYYFLGKLEAQGSKVIVELGKQDERGSSSSGTVYQYRKVSGKWRGKPTGGFVTCAAPARAGKENPSKQ